MHHLFKKGAARAGWSYLYALSWLQSENKEIISLFLENLRHTI